MVAGRLRGYLILALVFLLGAVAGAASLYAFVQRRAPFGLVDDRVDERRLEILTTELSLDAGQRVKIAGILNDAKREARAISHEMDAKCGHPLLDHRAKIDDRIRAELAAAQQAKFDELLARRRARASGKDPLGP